MDLQAIANGIISFVNPNVLCTVTQSTGYSNNAAGQPIPTYAPPVPNVSGQLQPLTSKDLRQLEGLNLQGYQRAIYFSGRVDGLVRATMQGGDLITTPDGNVWLVTIVLEQWSGDGGTGAPWCKVAVTLQDGS